MLFKELESERREVVVLDAENFTWKELSRRYQRLLQEAEKAMERAYCPYSGFSVGAAVLTQSGKIINGCNYEVAAYGDSICAERTALTSANTEGHGKELRAIAVIARNRGSPTDEVTAPCGSCRQMLVEAAQVAGYDLEVILSTTLRDKIVFTRISELLPLAFGPNNLGSKEDPTDLAQIASAAS